MENILLRCRSWFVCSYDYRKPFVIIFLIGIVFSNLHGASDHPLKMSVAELTYNSDKQYYELELRIFADDFLEAQGINMAMFDISPAMVQQYVSDKLKFQFNNERQKLKFVKMNVEGLTITSHWRIKNVNVIPEGIQKIMCENQILTTEFSRQRNLVHILLDNGRRTLLFDKSQHSATVEY